MPERVGPGSSGKVADNIGRCADGKPGHPLGLLTVYHRNCNFSAFNGYHRTPSDYSLIGCGGCGLLWRTNARYVDSLSDWRPPLKKIADLFHAEHAETLRKLDDE